MARRKKEVFSYPRPDRTEWTRYADVRVNALTGVETPQMPLRIQKRFLFNDSQTARRKKPSLPQLNPTSLMRAQLECDLGGYDTLPWRTSGSYWSVTNMEFTVDSKLWRYIPGVSTSSGDYMGITRSVDQEYACGNKVLKRIKDGSMNMPVAIAEAGKTAAWMASRAASIAHVVNAVGVSKWTRLRKLVNSLGDKPPKTVVLGSGRYGYKVDKTTLHRNPNRLPADPPDGWSSMDLAKRWLEVQYAVGPFINDVTGGAKALAVFLEEKQLTYMTTWDKECRFATRKSTFDYNPGTPVFSSEKPWIEITSVVTYRMKIEYIIDLYLASFVRAGLTNFPIVAYELMPWSFVLDWGITVGDFLELCDATVACKFLAGTSSYTLDIDPDNCVVSAGGKTGEAGGMKVIRTQVPVFKAQCYTRNTLVSFPTPHVVVKSPLSGAHVATALSLMRTSFSR